MFSTKVRAVSRLTNLTKSSFKENLKWGKLNGFKKASW
jgi:ribosomal protein S14